MRSLADLLHSPEGRDFLLSKDVLLTHQAFTNRLQLPRDSRLAAHMHQNGKKLICSGQQLYIDYHRSVLAKMETARQLAQDNSLFPFFLWVDTDRAGSDNLMTKLAWPSYSKKGAITILPSKAGDTELRFVELELEILRSAMDKVETFLRQSAGYQPSAKPRYQQLRANFANENPGTLSCFNLHLTNFLLHDVFDYTPPAVVLSDLIEGNFITAEINAFITQIDEVIAVFNEAVNELIRQDIDPQVNPLAEHYLPLFFSCPTDNRRLRLYHQREGGDHFAMSRCKCGQEYRFYLGRKELSIAELTQTRRWSPDVCFPLFFNDMVSGFVAGKSSTLYLLVINEVLSKVLTKTPVPMLVPPGLSNESAEPDPIDSLIYTYLSGH